MRLVEIGEVRGARGKGYWMLNVEEGKVVYGGLYGNSVYRR
jgi:hypothetical protein